MAEAIIAYFRAGKLGAREEDSQDRARGLEQRGSARCAVADGVSSAFRSGEWAARLVDSFLGLGVGAAPRLRADDLDDWFGRVQQDWNDRPPPPPTTPYAAEKARKAKGGSYATFVGCEIEGLESPEPRWAAAAIGDSVAFHVRDGVLLEHFPPVSEFGPNPAAISTRPERRAWMRRELLVRPAGEDPMRIGDLLFLATDAVAAWLLKQQCPQLWHRLAALDHPDVFAAWMTQCRRARTMDDDDVTLLRVEIAAGTNWLKVAL